MNLMDSVLFIDSMLLDELKHYTANADFGLSLDKPSNLNYVYSLPNKVFDYIHVGVPIVASNLPEVRKIIEKYKVGMCVSEIKPIKIAKTIKELIQNKPQLKQWETNSIFASLQLNWQKESEKLKVLFQDLI